MFLRSYDLAQHTSVEVEWIWHIVCSLFPFVLLKVIINTSYSIDCIQNTMKETVRGLLGESFLPNIFFTKSKYSILFLMNHKYKPMHPHNDNIHLVDHFDFHCNVIKELPRGIQSAIDIFYPSFDIVTAATRQKVINMFPLL